MSDRPVSAPDPSTPDSSPFDALVGASFQASSPGAEFTAAFRGYDRDEVDRAIARLTAQVRVEGERVAELTERQRHAGAADAQARATVERLQRDLAAAQARVVTAEGRIEALTDELVGATADSPSRPQFEEILRVAEEQASVLVRNASTQGERLLVAAREEVQNRRSQAQAEADAIRAQAEHDAAQVRLRIDTELTAHQALIERETAHATEKVAQAEQEAAAVRAESEKGAAALRSMVARETTHARAEAEEAVRELRVRALEFEESLTRRQHDAQQEFLVLHNQAVAHSERITLDANDQVAASLEHAQRVAAKADDFERLMRAQAAQIEADANIRARETLERARDKAQKIIDMVSTHSQSVLRDAEDRTRHLRWQQHQLTSFMSEVKELIRPQSGSDASIELAVVPAEEHELEASVSEHGSTVSPAPDQDEEAA
ncbi:DivIVA domain-containing protein [Microbacterium lacus]|uniref:DivIVA domain-containing protein n=1 Tax=Microbacterium lacus TaxID=415217 RepID=UPI00384F7BCE